MNLKVMTAYQLTDLTQAAGLKLPKYKIIEQYVGIVHYLHLTDTVREVNAKILVAHTNKSF